ncbi:MAG: hypothetical protein ABI625_22180 [bacterium]
MSMRSREGFALVAILWVLTVASVLGAGAALQGREAYNVSRNRLNAERAYWVAEGCVAEVLASADGILASSTEVQQPRVWRTIDVSIDSATVALSSECEVGMRAMGSRIDVNGASETLLRKYFVEAVGSTEGGAMSDALLDWRDADVDVRSAGAEEAWYMTNERPSPRNAAFAAEGELQLVRGLESRPELTAHLTVNSSLICLATAPAPVLAALPGFTEEVVERVLADRAAGRPMIELRDLMTGVSRAAAESLVVHFSELSILTTLEPRGWELTVRAVAGFPSVTVTSEVWFDRYGDHVVVLRRRTQ